MAEAGTEGPVTARPQAAFRKMSGPCLVPLSTWCLVSGQSCSSGLSGHVVYGACGHGSGSGQVERFAVYAAGQEVLSRRRVQACLC